MWLFRKTPTHPWATVLSKWINLREGEKGKKKGERKSGGERKQNTVQKGIARKFVLTFTKGYIYISLENS